MTSTIDPLMQRAGPPTQIVIYPDTDRAWHFAIYHTREIADGRLDIPPAASPATARTAAEALLHRICQRFYHSTPSIAWQPPDDNGMISGQVTTSTGAPRT